MAPSNRTRRTRARQAAAPIAGAAFLGALARFAPAKESPVIVQSESPVAFIPAGRGSQQVPELSAVASAVQPASSSLPRASATANTGSTASAATAATVATALALLLAGKSKSSSTSAKRPRASATLTATRVDDVEAPAKDSNNIAVAGVVAAGAAVAAVAMASADPAAAAVAAEQAADVTNAAADVATAAADVASAAADAAVEAAPESNELDQGTDFFSPFVQFNAGIIAGIDDILEDNLKLPNSFGAAIVLYTVAIKALTFPLNQSSLRTNAMMQLVGPKIKQLQAKYKNDQETQNRMMLRLYDDCGINPLGGCIPSLIQLPIFVALYRGINSLAQKNPKFQEPFLWIPSLSGPVEIGKPGIDWLVKSKIENGFEPLVGWEDAGRYLILPVMLVASQFITQRQSAPQQSTGGPLAFVTNFFPLIIGYTTLCSPAGLGIYWFVNNLLTSAQTQFIRNELGNEFPEYRKILDGTAEVPDSKDKKEEKEEVVVPTRGFAVAARSSRIEQVEEDDEDDEEEEVTTKETVQVAPAPKKMSVSAARDEKWREQRKAKRLAKKRRR